MLVDTEPRRILLAAQPNEAETLHQLFANAALVKWELLDAASFERARFLLQHNTCDILLIDENFISAGASGLGWLARNPDAPTVLLSSMEPETLACAYQQGVSMCLPREVAFNHPEVLAAALDRTTAAGQSRHALRRSADRLHQCRRQVDRLVNLLWRKAPTDLEKNWCTHRHVLERLLEEVARSGRHGNELTLAIGEVQAAEGDQPQSVGLTEWTTAAVSKAKRRCDIAGNYGTQEFMLLMVHTDAPGGLKCCRRLQKTLENAAAGPRGPVKAYFGLSTFSSQYATAPQLLMRAEKHLKAAKAGTDAGVVAE
jgi:hypothetical protein